jgi:tricorn protease
MRKLACSAFSLIAVFVFAAFAKAEGPLLLQKPTLSRTQIAFAYAGELWSVPREGGEARLLTSGGGTKSNPVFSPDGSMIAFTGDYDGNVDVYVMPSGGGVPRRLTHHPAADDVIGWTPDGQQVLFRSPRNHYAGHDQLFTVSVKGGLPHELPLPMAEFGSFSPDGGSIAYVPADNGRRGSFTAWKHYRGGLAPKIWVTNLSTLNMVEVPREASNNDDNPMWVGDKIYFLSDRNGPFSLFAYDPKTNKVEQALPSNGADIKAASAGPGGIVYEQLGSLGLFDPASGKAKAVSINVPADLPNVRPHFRKVEHDINTANLSPSGARAVFEAHGEILTVPAEKGDIRNLTHTPGVMERDPAWSPDGKWVAYFSDESGEYQLFIQSSDGLGETKKFSLGAPASFYYMPIWSPDSKKIAYSDKGWSIWYLDLEKGVPVKVDADTYFDGGRISFYREPPAAWSPDSRWIAYTKNLTNYSQAVFAYSLEEGKSLQLTDGLSDARFPAFDQKGEYLYFTASTDLGPTLNQGDLSGYHRAVTRSAYLIVLRNDQSSPLARESDEEKSAEEDKSAGDKSASSRQADTADEPSNPDEKAKAHGPSVVNAAKSIEAVHVRIDAENINQRILALPIPARNYTRMVAGGPGTIFLIDREGLTPVYPGRPGSLWRFDLASRKTEKLMEGIDAFVLSFDGKKMLYSRGLGEERKWFIASATAPAKAEGGEKALKLSGMEVLVDPRAEWRQEYNEAWRLERDFFYDPNFHGLNLAAARKQYEPFLQNLGSRDDFSYLLADMLGELGASHLAVVPARTVASVLSSVQESFPGKVGLLGADYTVENGRYRFGRIYFGENWNPQLRAPLTEPGVNVRQGDYLLAVNGRELHGTDEIFQLFEGTAEKATVLRIAASADGKNARNVTVVPTESEEELRNRAWIDQNRRKVDQLSGGRLAYVYLPDTFLGGYDAFNRYFFAQSGREGAVIDERFNGGGALAHYMIDFLGRPLRHYEVSRYGRDAAEPAGAIFGPKAMLINMYSQSGGDALPWYFRDARIGPLVGTRTWGGLISAATRRLMDGGVVTAPNRAFYNRNGEWDVENHGVQPDYEVELTPKDWAEGRDPQLEKAVELVLDSLKKNPLPVAKRPAYPNYHEAQPAASGAGGEEHK